MINSFDKQLRSKVKEEESNNKVEQTRRAGKIREEMDEIKICSLTWIGKCVPCFLLLLVIIGIVVVGYVAFLYINNVSRDDQLNHLFELGKAGFFGVIGVMINNKLKGRW